MEQVLDPNLTICDPHIHIGAHSDERFMVEELRAETESGHRVVATVFVECGVAYRPGGSEAFRPIGETEFVVAADPDGVIAGIVGYADLRVPEIGDVLAAHADAGGGRLRGIRNNSAWDASPDLRRAPPGLLADHDFRRGIAALERADLSFETWLYHHQLPELAALSRDHPNAPIIVNHLGGPIAVGPYHGQRSEVLNVWRSGMRELAACPNVVVKLGGIGMAFFGMDWHERPDGASSEEVAAAWGDEMRWCIEQFGVERCMFESNFPVDRISFSYPVLWNAFKRVTADASDAERAALFHDTATRVYRL
jgi:predicted TIM-barrel fold metal-dependent hydrolase